MKAPLTGASPLPGVTSQYCRPEVAVIMSGQSAPAAPASDSVAAAATANCLTRSVGSTNAGGDADVATARRAWRRGVGAAGTMTVIAS